MPVTKMPIQKTTIIFVAEKSHFLLGLYIDKLKHLNNTEIYSSSFYYGVTRLIPQINPNIIIVGTNMILAHKNIIKTIRKTIKNKKTPILIVGSMDYHKVEKLLDKNISGFVDILRHSIDDLNTAVQQILTKN
jgi:hypothetical protein